MMIYNIQNYWVFGLCPLYVNYINIQASKLQPSHCNSPNRIICLSMERVKIMDLYYVDASTYVAIVDRYCYIFL
jgi:hypothetical protein